MMAAYLATSFKVFKQEALADGEVKWHKPQ